MRPDLVVPGENEENFVVARDARVVTVPFSPIEKRFANCKNCGKNWATRNLTA